MQLEILATDELAFGSRERAEATASIPGLLSTPVTDPVAPTCSAAPVATAPVPHATSSTDCPSRSWAEWSTTGTQGPKIAGTRRSAYTSGALPASCQRSMSPMPGRPSPGNTPQRRRRDDSSIRCPSWAECPTLRWLWRGYRARLIRWKSTATNRSDARIVHDRRGRLLDACPALACYRLELGFLVGAAKRAEPS